MEVYSFAFSPFGVNTYVIADASGQCAVLDCGCYHDGEFERLSSFIDDNKLKPVLLLNTHCHPDHIFGNLDFLKKYNIRTQYHREEDYSRVHAVEEAEAFGLEMAESPAPCRYIEPDEEIIFGSTVLKALFVPGHSPGGLAFYNKDAGVVFSGDSLFNGSIGRTDLYGGNYEQLIKSVENELFTLPAETVVYPGHGNETSIAIEKTTNPYFKH